MNYRGFAINEIMLEDTFETFMTAISDKNVEVSFQSDSWWADEGRVKIQAGRAKAIKQLQGMIDDYYAAHSEI